MSKKRETTRRLRRLVVSRFFIVFLSWPQCRFSYGSRFLVADRKKRKRAYTSKRQFNFPSRLEHIILYTLGGVDSRKAPHVNGLSIVGGWGDASGQGGDVTKNSDFNKLFAGCPLNIATHVRDRAAQIQENEQKARNLLSKPHAV